jgi:hypothetical protein
VENYDDIYNELKNSAPLLSEMKKVNYYEVSKDYFLHFTQFMSEKIQKGDAHLELNEVSPLLAQIEKPITEELPNIYFNSLPEILLKKIRHTEVSEELKIVAPALPILKKANLYEVPASYFEQNPLRILETIRKEEKENSKKTNLRWVWILEEFVEIIQNFLAPPKYALVMAGCFAVLILGSIFFTNSDVSDEQKIVAQLRGINNDELSNYIAMNMDEIQEHHILQNSNDVDFSSFLENTKEVNTNLEEYILSGIDEDEIGKELRD